ncbi:DUF6243 family protein [Streptomyces exfoliatus]|uniref:DUF6243 family protein n=1 Tax=Streptomyces exfoliatus TaxID=1905 RepID=UPI003C302DDE
MAKRNNLLGVGGQRKKLSRDEQHGGVQSADAARRTADEQKQELLKKMRERAQGTENTAGAENAENSENTAGAEGAETGEAGQK